MRRIAAPALVALLALLATAVGLAFASTVVVTPASPAGWEISNYDAPTDTASAAPTTSGTRGQFVNGPAAPPAGSGSFNQIVGSNGDDAQRIRTSAYNGLPLSSISELKYSTYVTNNNGGQATYVQLFVDQDGDGSTDDILFFEPVYQNGGYGTIHPNDTVPNQCSLSPYCVTLNTWQSWDAKSGGWWSLNESGGGPPLITLAAYVAEHPGARLATDSPALRFTAGFGGLAWEGFNGNVDKVIVNGTTYDFELYSSPANKDQCKNGGWATFNPNRAAGAFKNQGDCVQFANTGK